MNQRAIDRVIARIRAVEEYGSSIPPYSRDAEEFARAMLDAEPEPVPQYSQREVLVIQTAAQFSVGDSTDGEAVKRYSRGLVYNGCAAFPKMFEDTQGTYVEYAEIERIKRTLAGPGTSEEKIAAIAEMVK